MAKLTLLSLEVVGKKAHISVRIGYMAKKGRSLHVALSTPTRENITYCPSDCLHSKNLGLQCKVLGILTLRGSPDMTACTHNAA